MLLPATTGSGEAALVTSSSAPALDPTIVDATAVLLLVFGSLAEELTDATFVITVPFAVPAVTLATREKVAAVPPLRLKSVQTTFPVPPTAGVLQLQLAGAINETNVVFAGIASDSVALSAALGPLLVTTCA